MNRGSQLSFFSQLVLTFTSAVLVVASFPPWNLWPVVFVALIPFYWVLDSITSLKRQALLSLFWGMVMSAGGMWWAGPAAVTYGELPRFVGPVLVLLMSTIAEIQAPLIFPLRGWIRSRRFGAFLFALAYASIDGLIPKLWKDTLGHVFHAAPPLLQWAEVGSAPLLTLFAVWINELLFDALKARAVKPALLALGIFLIAYGFGITRLEDMRTYESAAQHPRSTWIAVQPNIEDYQKVAAERGFYGAGDTIVDTYLRLSESSLAASPDWIVWPETAFPFLFRNPETEFEKKHVNRVRAFVETSRVPIGFGGYDFEPQTGETFNSIFFLHADQSLGVYRKHHLLMFGEYLPFADVFPSLKTWIPNIGFFGRGKGPSVFSLPLRSSPGRTVQVGPTICYEALIPDYSIESVRLGAELLLNVTNDGWFGDTGEPHHHLAQVRFRSVETRTPQLRVTNTGITALILPSGDLRDPISIGKVRAERYEVPLLPRDQTVVVRFGNWLPKLGLLVFFLLGLTRQIRLFRKRTV